VTPGEVKAIFEPKSVVLVGASGVKERAGMAPSMIFRSVIHNMLRFYKGKTHIVDLSGRVGTAVKSFRQVPKKQDLAVLVLPPKLVLRHLRKLLDRRVRAILAITGGYTREQRGELLRLTSKQGVRVLGPNTIMGVINTANGLCTIFERDIMPQRGNIAVISQSSGMGAAMLDWAWFYGTGISKFAFMGDRIDVSEAELVEYLGGDKDTKVICVYMEGIRDGRKFIDAVQKVVGQKPVVVLRGGVTQGGRPMPSRAASFAGQDKVFGAAFERAGAIRVHDIEELFDVANALAKQPPMQGNRVAIVSNVGGPAILAADSVYREGLVLANLSDKATKTIIDRYPEVDPVNPIDIATDAKAERYEFILKQVLADPNVDGVMVINMLKSCLLEPEDTRILAEVARKFKDKPIVDVSVGGVDHVLVSEVLKGTNVPTYNLPDKAARALKALYLYGKIREKVTRE